MKNSQILAVLFAVAAAAETVPTEYDLTLFSRPGYKGQAVKVHPNQCMSLDNHNISDAEAIRLSGNNVCMFYPSSSCDRMHQAQPVMGDIPNTGVWGFPNGVGAVKCLSHGAAEVLKNHRCAFDPACASASEQGQCPFERSCSQYANVDHRDWQRYTEPGVNPVKERYHVGGDGEDADGHIEAPKRQPPAKIETESRRNWEGGSDDYSQPWAPEQPAAESKQEAKVMEQQSREKAKEADKQARKDAKRKQKEQKAYEKAQFRQAEKERKAKKAKAKAKAKAMERIKNGL